MKREDSVILFKEKEIGKFDRVIYFLFATAKGATYCQYELDNVTYEAFNQMDDEGQERFLNRLVQDEMYDKIREIKDNELKLWIESNQEAKIKYREFKLNKIID